MSNRLQQDCIGFHPKDDDLRSTVCDHMDEKGRCAFFQVECDAPVGTYDRFDNPLKEGDKVLYVYLRWKTSVDVMKVTIDSFTPAMVRIVGANGRTKKTVDAHSLVKYEW